MTWEAYSRKLKKLSIESLISLCIDVMPQELIPSKCKNKQEVINEIGMWFRSDEKRRGILLNYTIDQFDKPSASNQTQFGIPELPPHFLELPEHVDQLVKVLLSEDGAKKVGIHGLHGMGGNGKTVLASCVARNPAIRNRFRDGVYWLNVGKKPETTSLLAELGRALGMSHVDFQSPSDAKRRMIDKLAERPVLLVLDDVWEAADAYALDVVRAPGRTLMTTRNLDVLIKQEATVHKIDIMTEERAIALLSRWTGIAPEELPSKAQDLAKACGYLPVALAMAGAQIGRPPGSWSRVLNSINSARLDRIRSYLPWYPQYKSVYQVIQASVDQFVDNDDIPQAARCYAELAVFAEDEIIPRDALRVLWGRLGLKEGDIGDLGSIFAAYALATLEENPNQSDEWQALRLHDIPRAYVIARIRETSDLPTLHGEFVKAMASRCELGLDRGPTGEMVTAGERAYFFKRLPYHLLQAGQETRLRDLLMSYSWLDAKLRATNLVEVLADFERMEFDETVLLVRDTLRLASNILTKDAAHLPAQLIGRLDYFKDNSFEVHKLLEQTRQQAQGMWLCPITSSLTPPNSGLLCTFAKYDVCAVALSEDGSRALTGSRDNSVNLWDTSNGQLIRTFEGHTDYVNGVALSRDCKLAVSGSKDGTLRIWSTDSTQAPHVFQGDNRKILGVALSGDGRLALSGGNRALLELWNTNSGFLRKFDEEHGAWVNGVALSGDGSLALSGSGDGKIILWSTDSGRALRILGTHSSTVYAVALSGDGKLALAGSRELQLWCTDSGRLLHTFEGHRGTVLKVALNWNGRLAISGSDDRTVKLWDTDSRQLLRTFQGHTSRILGVALSRDGRFALSGSVGTGAKLWDTERDPLGPTIQKHSGSVNVITLSKDGRLALSASSDRTVRLWDAYSGQFVRGFKEHTTAAALSGDGSFALSASSDGMVKQWDTDSGQLLHTFKEHDGVVKAVALSGDDKRMIAGYSDGTLNLWAADSGQFLYSFTDHVGAVQAVALSGDGRLALSGADDGTVKLWDTDSGQLPSTLKHGRHTLKHEPRNTIRVALSGDGRFALSGSDGGMVELWDTESRQLIKTFRGQGYSITGIALSGDGRFALSGSGGGAVELWDTKSHRDLAAFQSDSSILCCALSMNEKPVICAGDETGYVHFLRLLPSNRELISS